MSFEEWFEKEYGTSESVQEFGKSELHNAFFAGQENGRLEKLVSQKNAEGLLPCPFCGYEAEIRIRGTQHNSMIIACTHCGGKIESGDVYGLTKPEHYHWNKRI